MESAAQSASERFSRLFRKAGVFLGKGQFTQALVVFREGEALALALDDQARLALFREEIAHCLAHLTSSAEA